MKNSKYNYTHVYTFIRSYYLSILPMMSDIEPYMIMNTHLEAQGSALRMAQPGFSQNATYGQDGELERFLCNSQNRDELYEDISGFIVWMEGNGYLKMEVNSSGNEFFLATDKLVRTPSLDF